MGNTTTNTGKTSQQHENGHLKTVSQEVSAMLDEHMENGYSKSFNPNLHNPINPATSNVYKGFNQIYLNRITDKNHFEVNYYLPHNKISSTGGMVKKGQKSIRVYSHTQNRYYDTHGEDITKEIELKKDNNETIEKEHRHESKVISYAVFNIEQTRGIPQKYHFQKEKEWAKHEYVLLQVNNLIKNLQINKDHRKKAGEKGYNQALDTIHIPAPENYEVLFQYLDDLFPMVTEAINHPERLNRKIDPLPESKDYLLNKLANEMAASSLAHDFGYFLTITKDDGLIKEWQRLLERDPYFLLNSTKQMNKTLEYTKKKVLSKQVMLQESNQMEPEVKIQILNQDGQKQKKINKKKELQTIDITHGR